MTKRKIFKYLRDKNFTLKKIAINIGISLKTSKRWNIEYKENMLIRNHGLKNKPSNFKTKIDKNSIVSKYLTSSFEISKDGRADPYNFSYFIKYKLKEKCSLSTFANIMNENFIASPWANKKKRKYFNSILKLKLKSNCSSDEIKLIKKKIAFNEKTYFRKPRPEHVGEIHEIDASKDYWLNFTYSHLYAVYDPATKAIKSLHIEKEETTRGYLKLIKPLAQKNEMSQLFKADCRSTFVINKKDAGALAHKDVNIQLGFILNKIGSEMENSSEPTFKGGVERLFRTLQNQLKDEFRERKITNFEEANIFLKKYMNQYNKQYSIKAIKDEIKYIKTKLSYEEIYDLFSIRVYRKSDKGNSISYKGYLYSLYDQKGNRVSFKEKSPILICEWLDGSIIGFYMGEKLTLKKTDFKFLSSSQKEQYINQKRLTPNYSATDYHPWGYKVFLLFLIKSKQLKRYLKK